MVWELVEVVLEFGDDFVRGPSPEGGVGAADEAGVWAGGAAVEQCRVADGRRGEGLEHVGGQFGQPWQQRLEVAAHVQHQQLAGAVGHSAVLVEVLAAVAFMLLGRDQRR